MKNNIKKIVYVVITIIVIACYVYFFSGKFSVSKITLLGQPTYTKDKIMELAKIDTSKNIYLINTRNIEKNLEKDNYIEKAVVKQRFPREITILITERIPVASIPVNGGYVIIDENARAINIVQDEKKVKKPIISGIKVQDVKLEDIIKVKNQEDLGNILKIIKEVSGENLLENISYINLKKLDDISMTTKTGILVRFGDMSNSEYKCKLLNKILIDLSTKGKMAGNIDMRFDTDPVYY